MTRTLANALDLTQVPAITASPATPSRAERISLRLQRTADGRAGLIVLYVWAFAEAWMWPLIPDSALLGMAFASPRRFARQWVATIAGSISGGAAALLVTRAGASWPLPLVTGRMREAAAGWLEVGASGLWHQPLSGVPYKAFVRAAAETDIGVADWMLATLGARGSRMLAMALLGAFAGVLLRRFVPADVRGRVHVTAVVGGTFILFGVLAAVVTWWS